MERRAVVLMALVPIVLSTRNTTASLNVIVMGDWGGQDDSPYTTPGQLTTAKSMASCASQHGAAFVLALGDNFYDNGVKSTQDKRWTATFEDVYTSQSLQVPWYVVAGNHDHYGNIQAQVDYSKLSHRWNFPALYYTFSKVVQGSNVQVQFVMIDTVTFAGRVDDASQCMKNSSRCILRYPGPSDEGAAKSQLAWIESTLANSTADHLIVAGHYPVYSAAEHGPTAALVESLEPLLDKYKAHYFNGHEHTMEFINLEGEFVGYYTTGAAHGCEDDSNSHASVIPKGSLQYHACKRGGFTRMEVTTKGMTMYYHDADGSLVYTAPTKVPRSQAPPPPPPGPCKDKYKYTCQKSWCSETYWYNMCQKTCGACH